MIAVYLKGRCHISFGALKDFFREVMGIAVSCDLLIAKRMRKGEDEYFRFIEAGTEATNNPAELGQYDRAYWIVR
jgi:hypothetical protein